MQASFLHLMVLICKVFIYQLFNIPDLGAANFSLDRFCNLGRTRPLTHSSSLNDATIKKVTNEYEFNPLKVLPLASGRRPWRNFRCWLRQPLMFIFSPLLNSRFLRQGGGQSMWVKVTFEDVFVSVLLQLLTWLSNCCQFCFRIT